MENQTLHDAQQQLGALDPAIEKWKDSVKDFAEHIRENPRDFPGHIDRGIDVIGNAAAVDTIKLLDQTIDQPIDKPMQ